MFNRNSPWWQRCFSPQWQIKPTLLFHKINREGRKGGKRQGDEHIRLLSHWKESNKLGGGTKPFDLFTSALPSRQCCSSFNSASVLFKQMYSSQRQSSMLPHLPFPSFTQITLVTVLLLHCSILCTQRTVCITIIYVCKMGLRRELNESTRVIQ